MTTDDRLQRMMDDPDPGRGVVAWMMQVAVNDGIATAQSGTDR